jgi:hypothetical protein
MASPSSTSCPPLHSFMAELLSEQTTSPKEVRMVFDNAKAASPTQGCSFKPFPHTSPTQLRKRIQHSRWESACDTIVEKTNMLPASRWESPNVESRFDFPACPRRSGDMCSWLLRKTSSTDPQQAIPDTPLAIGC